MLTVAYFYDPDDDVWTWEVRDGARVVRTSAATTYEAAIKHALIAKRLTIIIETNGDTK